LDPLLEILFDCCPRLEVLKAGYAGLTMHGLRTLCEKGGNLRHLRLDHLQFLDQPLLPKKTYAQIEEAVDLLARSLVNLERIETRDSSWTYCVASKADSFPKLTGMLHEILLLFVNH
jgi:hypothetical protein